MFGPITLRSKIHNFELIETRELPKNVYMTVFAGKMKVKIYVCKDCGLEGELWDYEGNDWVECECAVYRQYHECIPVQKSEGVKKKTLKNILQSFDI